MEHQEFQEIVAIQAHLEFRVQVVYQGFLVSVDKVDIVGHLDFQVTQEQVDYLE